MINYLSNILMIRVPRVIKGLALAPLLLLAKTALCTLMWCSNKCIYLFGITLFHCFYIVVLRKSSVR